MLAEIKKRWKGLFLDGKCGSHVTVLNIHEGSSDSVFEIILVDDAVLLTKS